MASEHHLPPETEENLGALRSRVRRRATLKTSFLTGLVVAAPIGITVFLVWTFVDLVDDWVRPIVLQVTPRAWHQVLDSYAAIPGLGLLLAVAAVTLLGALTANIFGRTVVAWGDGVVHKLPIIGSIYKTLKQIFETVVNQTEETFKEVCLVEFPRKDCWCIAFVVGSTKGEIALKAEGDLVSVFLPHAPSPASGYLMFLPKEQVQILDMTVEEGIKFVVSIGIVTPAYEPGLSDKLRAAVSGGGTRRSSLLNRIARKLQTAN
jgi:uncharacterized membrane protein